MVARRYLLVCALAACCLLSCQQNAPAPFGRLHLDIAIQVDGQPIEYHNLQYVNAAQNPFQVDEVRFFISAVKLIAADGAVTTITDRQGIHYFDSQVSGTDSWALADSLAIGSYTHINFVFGLPPEQNVTGFFVNPPENAMAWPDVLGGGYHYMQINGRWSTPQDSLRPFNLHTGIGQLYENGSVTQFVDNSFEVTLSLNDLKISENETAHRTLVMEVANWMRSPNVYDFNVWGGAIMQNQEAQQILRENGANVFSILP